MTVGGAYVRVYYAIMDDGKFEAIYGDDHHLATWLRLLIVADQIWPAYPPIPAGVRRPSYRALVAVGLVDEMPRHCYRIHGLDAERMKRSQSARNAAAVRWQSAGNAPASVPQSDRNASHTRAESESESESESETGLPTPERAVGHGSNGPTKPKKVRGFATIPEVDFLQDTIDRRQHEAWQSFGGEWDAFKAAWISRGLKYPPRGTDEDRPSDASPSPRAMLWSILDSRPDDLVRWVREAPRGSVANVIGHVLREWHAIREEVGRETAVTG